ncbi:MAG: DUF4012 domain-containing protein [Candidatus Moranbacteria bacterium]|nr:DUF4012 domain-containing protein [Candidatus Moranbacteria bacterium]
MDIQNKNKQIRGSDSGQSYDHAHDHAQDNSKSASILKFRNKSEYAYFEELKRKRKSQTSQDEFQSKPKKQRLREGVVHNKKENKESRGVENNFFNNRNNQTKKQIQTRSFCHSKKPETGPLDLRKVAKQKQAELKQRLKPLVLTAKEPSIQTPKQNSRPKLSEINTVVSKASQQAQPEQTSQNFSDQANNSNPEQNKAGYDRANNELIGSKSVQPVSSRMESAEPNRTSESAVQLQINAKNLDNRRGQDRLFFEDRLTGEVFDDQAEWFYQKDLAASNQRSKASKNRNKRSLLRQAFSPGLKTMLKYSFLLALLIVVLPIIMIAIKGYEEKDSIEEKGIKGYENLKQAQASIQKADIASAGKNFDLAYKNFMQASDSLEEVGGATSNILRFVPGVSKVESAKRMARVGENISLAGKEATGLVEYLIKSKDQIKHNIIPDKNQLDEYSGMTMTDMFLTVNKKIYNLNQYIGQANADIEVVNPKDFPKEVRDNIGALKEFLPEISSNLEEFSQYSDLFLDIVGHNGTRRYLIVFQNNHEMRATGGFIGSYGVVKVHDGKIENLHVDGIYNPDGQLQEKIIPPKPIQKMIPNWSMHDANWWPDFPTSAQKISWFYEKTGGPTVDAVIAITPEMILDLLKITGPIKIQNYGEQGEIIIDSSNFMELIQEEVEVNYDKQENRPKKILADLTPILISQVFAAGPEKWPRILNVFSDSLKKRNLMLYSFDYEIQNLISNMGWSGEVLETKKDYLSVINTNIGGKKSDRAIKQTITHEAEVQNDGSIINKVTIRRKHQGGDFEHDWYNSVNADWMRIYVPKGSQLINATGFTREFVNSELDYEKLGFKHDYQIKEMEDSYEIDELSATRIYEEFDKTVFANWVYTSPGDTVTVTVEYMLPFRVKIDDLNPAEVYSLLIQKQAGDENTDLKLVLKGLNQYYYEYKYPEDMEMTKNGWNIETSLNKDKFYSIVFTNEKAK